MPHSFPVGKYEFRFKDKSCPCDDFDVKYVPATFYSVIIEWEGKILENLLLDLGFIRISCCVERKEKRKCDCSQDLPVSYRVHPPNHGLANLLGLSQ